MNKKLKIIIKIVLIIAIIAILASFLITRFYNYEILYNRFKKLILESEEINNELGTIEMVALPFSYNKTETKGRYATATLMSADEIYYNVEIRIEKNENNEWFIYSYSWEEIEKP